MKELDVRLALYNHEVRTVLAKQPMTLVIDELGLMEGAYRIDLALINSHLHGYEIKSKSDNLERLTAQQSVYNKVFDRMTLVADERHVQKAVKIIPQWWGLISSSTMNGVTQLNEIWPSRLNLDVDPYLMAQLLWRGEALDVLTKKGIKRGYRTKSRKLIWQAIAATLTVDEIRQAIRTKLAARDGWRTKTYG